MSDLETSTDTQGTNLQPTDAVAAEVEEITTPQSDDGKIVIDVDEQESGQEPNAQSVDNDSAIYKRMKKEKEKRKREHEERLKAEADKESLRKELEELRSQVNPIVNPKPTLESCDYDNDRYEREIAAYYQNQGDAPAKPQAQAKGEEQFNEQAFEADFYLKHKEDEVTKAYPKYNQDKSELLNKFTANGGNEQTFTFLSNIASQANIDIAKANIALNRNSELFNSLLSAAGAGNQFAVADVLRQAASKVDLRVNKKIDTQPTPDIQNSGPIDNLAAEIEQAKNKWIESGSSADFKAYKAVKSKVK